MKKHRTVGLIFGLCLLASLCHAQSAVLDLPRDSQHATVTQRIGITDIVINYHRPLVKDRKIWGNVVPDGEVWRAGANENTTIAFGDPVTIEGKPLDKGTYGLHMIPNPGQWTIIFSRNYTAWGSFTYDPKEDALRVTVKPQASDFHNALTYDFDDVQPDSAVVTLRWEKLAVPFKIGVNVNDVVAVSLEKQLRGLGQYYWEGWDDGASYLVDHKGNLESALKYENKSIETEERFDNLMTKSRILEAMGRREEALATKNKAFEKATPLQLHVYARGLQQQKKQDEAFAIFRTNAKKYPNEWYTHSGLARVYSGEGKFDDAAREMKMALSKAPDQYKSAIQGQIKRLEAKQDINP